jgi:hypothetical protein
MTSSKVKSRKHSVGKKYKGGAVEGNFIPAPRPAVPTPVVPYSISPSTEVIQPINSLPVDKVAVASKSVGWLFILTKIIGFLRRIGRAFSHPGR